MLKFNPFTSSFDIVGGSSTYTTVNTYADLPSAASHTGEIYVVLTSTGIWPFNNKKGLYYSNGTAWSWLSEAPFEYYDGTFKIRNSSVDTKSFQFSAANITAGQNRTITIPDRDLTLNHITTNTTTNLTGLLKGSGSNVSAAVVGADYLTGTGTSGRLAIWGPSGITENSNLSVINNQIASSAPNLSMLTADYVAAAPVSQATEIYKGFLAYGQPSNGANADRKSPSYSTYASVFYNSVRKAHVFEWFGTGVQNTEYGNLLFRYTGDGGVTQRNVMALIGSTSSATTAVNLLGSTSLLFGGTGTGTDYTHSITGGTVSLISKPLADDAAAFKWQTSNGTDILTIDTSNSSIVSNTISFKNIGSSSSGSITSTVSGNSGISAFYLGALVDDQSSWVRFYGSTYSTTALRNCFEIWNNKNGIIRFGTNGTEYFRLSSIGDIEYLRSKYFYHRQTFGTETDGDWRTYSDANGFYIQNRQSGSWTTNYSMFEPDGTYKMVGTATVFDDLFPLSVTVGGGSSAPSYTAYNGNLKAYEFVGASLSKDLDMGFEIPHSYKEGSDITPHVHLYVPDDVTGGVIKFSCEYTWTNIDQTGSVSTTTISATLNRSANAGINNNAKIIFPAITGTGKTVSSIVMCRIFRDPTDSEDTFGSSVWLKSTAIHYEMDTLGSRTISSK